MESLPAELGLDNSLVVNGLTPSVIELTIVVLYREGYIARHFLKGYEIALQQW